MHALDPITMFTNPTIFPKAVADRQELNKASRYLRAQASQVN